MERLYGSHNRARPSRIVCQPSDVILWINTPFDTKNFKRKYESLIKLHHFWRWYFLFFGEAVKKKLTDFGQLFCYTKFFKNRKKKLTDFGQLFWLTGKKLAEIRCVEKRETTKKRRKILQKNKFKKDEREKFERGRERGRGKRYIITSNHHERVRRARAAVVVVVLLRARKNAPPEEEER